MFNLNLLDLIIIPIISLIFAFFFNLFTHKHNTKMAANDDKKIANETEILAYQRVEFLTDEIHSLREDLNKATDKIKLLELENFRRDHELLEADRLKQVALTEVTRLRAENDTLKEKLNHYENI